MGFEEHPVKSWGENRLTAGGMRALGLATGLGWRYGAGPGQDEQPPDVGYRELVLDHRSPACSPGTRERGQLWRQSRMVLWMEGVKPAGGLHAPFSYFFPIAITDMR